MNVSSATVGVRSGAPSSGFAATAVALRIEYRKLVTTRLWWLLAVVMVALLALASGGLALLATSGPARDAGNLQLDSAHDVVVLYNMTPTFGFVFPVLLGALSLTTEYRYQTITATFLACPRRWTVIVAKAVTSVGVGLTFALLGTAVCVASAGTALAATGNATHLGDALVVRALLGGVVATALWGLIGFGVGAVVRNQVVAVVVIVAFTQFVEPFLRLLFGVLPGGDSVSPFLPGAASDATAVQTLFSASQASALLSPVQGALVLSAYAAVLLVIGTVRTTRRTIA